MIKLIMMKMMKTMMSLNELMKMSKTSTIINTYKLINQNKKMKKRQISQILIIKIKPNKMKWRMKWSKQAGASHLMSENSKLKHLYYLSISKIKMMVLKHLN